MKLKYNRGTAKIRKQVYSLDAFLNKISRALSSQVKGLARLDFEKESFGYIIHTGFLRPLEDNSGRRNLGWKVKVKPVWQYKEYTIEGLRQNAYGISVLRRKELESSWGYRHINEDELIAYIFLSDLPLVKRELDKFVDTWVDNRSIVSLMNSKLQTDFDLAMEIMSPDFIELEKRIECKMYLKELFLILQDYDKGRKEARLRERDKAEAY